MHHWEVGGAINIGWPDFGRPERSYTIVIRTIWVKCSGLE